jgi:hypothetical protein
MNSQVADPYMTTKIVRSYVRHNAVAAGELSDLICLLYQTRSPNLRSCERERRLQATRPAAGTFARSATTFDANSCGARHVGPRLIATLRQRNFAAYKPPRPLSSVNRR